MESAHCSARPGPHEPALLSFGRAHRVTAIAGRKTVGVLNSRAF